MNNWKLKKCYLSRITEIHKKSVMLEVIIDDIIEEQEYDLNLFNSFNLKEEKFFKIKIFEKPRQQKLVIEKAKNITRKDFPKVNFNYIQNKDLFF